MAEITERVLDLGVCLERVNIFIWSLSSNSSARCKNSMPPSVKRVYKRHFSDITEQKEGGYEVLRVMCDQLPRAQRYPNYHDKKTLNSTQTLCRQQMS